MRITEIIIKNYKSFDLAGQSITLPTPHCALVGKNNTGKTNIFTALELLFGNKNPSYIRLEEEDYFDSKQPIEIKVTLSEFLPEDKAKLFSIPNLTKQQQGALSKKLSDGTASIVFLLRKSFEYVPVDNEEESEETKDTFDISMWGFNVFRKKEDIRKSIIRMLLVPANRDHKNELSASKWTQYGQLMKDVLENSPQYGSIKTTLSKLNSEIQVAFQDEKKKLLIGARVVSYVEDISFQLTKENQPSELLRNLEIFVKDNSKLFNIENVGTGTQSAIIIGILELALKSKSARAKVFCIEEPETFLHPHGIRYLGSLIRDISSDQNTQVLISTHSLSLTANFEPKEIIQVDKVKGKTIIQQAPTLDSTHFKRFIHQDNAEIFFSERIVFVEGATEKILFSNLDKITPATSAGSSAEDCNFDRINVGIIKLDSVDSIINYIKIAKAFKIPYSAIVDKDFLDKSICEGLCKEIGIVFQKTDLKKLLADLKDKNILVNEKGEIEDLFPDQEIATISGKPIADVKSIKSKYPQKTSKAFKEIFSTGKPEYAIRIADHYIQKQKDHPLSDLVRKLYSNDIKAIKFS